MKKIAFLPWDLAGCVCFTKLGCPAIDTAGHI